MPLLLLLLSLVPQAPAPAVTVSTCADLKTALNTASSNPINIPAATSIDVAACGGLGSISRTASFTLQGPASGALPTITGRNLFPIFTFGSSGTVYNFTIQNINLVNGTAIGGTNLGGCLYASDGNVRGVASGVNFIGCTAVNGGAVYMSGGAFSARNCTFVNNQAIGSGGEVVRGGAIASLGQRQLLAVSISSFSGNSARQTGNGIVTGGAVFADGNIVLQRCTFTNNFAVAAANGANGGAVYSYGSQSQTILAELSSFTNNYVQTLANGIAGGGGAIWGYTVTLRSSSFVSSAVRSTTTQTGQICIAGAVYAQPNLSVFNCSFANSIVNCGMQNEARGGAIYLLSYEDTQLTIDQSQFSNNLVTGSNSYGAAIFSMLSVAITSSTFTGNNATATAISQGGAIYSPTMKNTNSISSSTFASNSVQGTDNVVGGAYILFSARNIESNNFYFRNSATQILGGGNVQVAKAMGGAVAIFGYSSTVFQSTNSVFSNNSATSLLGEGAGGAVAGFPGPQLAFSASNFSRNAATSGCSVPQNNCGPLYGGGGAVFTTRDATFDSCSFVSNTHTARAAQSFANGGAIAAPPGSLSFSLTSSTFESNAAVASSVNSASGGALALGLPYQVLTIDSSVFNRNSATGASAAGGAISLTGGYATISTCSFSSNVAAATSGDSFGGAIDARPLTSQLSLFSCSFSSNSASSLGTGRARGGAVIYGGVDGSVLYQPLSLVQSSFSNNQASSASAAGGALYIGAGPYSLTARIARTSFDGSSVTGSNSIGAAIAADPSAILSFCGLNSFGKQGRNFRSTTANVSEVNDLDGSKEAHFCPSIPVYVDSSSTFNPLLVCDLCDCGLDYNPCDSKATCLQSGGYATCKCPAGVRGNGFLCGNILVCSN